MNIQQTTKKTTAEAYLERMAERGVEYVFANAGTDFAPIVEALSDNKRKYPRFLTVPHENVAMAMADGYYRVTGKPAGVMVHVTVGTANTICGLMNSSRNNVPIILAAGRTPITETGHIASRNRSIHWGQESFDQGGMVREFVKWDYELRSGQPAEAVVDRALDIAMSEPRGPVYLTLPREVLANPAIAPRRQTVRPMGSIAAEPSEAGIAQAAEMIAKAEFPLILTSSTGRSAAGFEALSKLAKAFALPVIQTEARDINISTDHPMHFGFDTSLMIEQADVILVLDAAVPWIPRASALHHQAKVIHIAPDPLESAYPYREFEGDLLIAGSAIGACGALGKALQKATKGQEAKIDKRRSSLAETRSAFLARRAKIAESTRGETPVNLAYLATCINEVKADNAIIVNELGLPVSQLNLTQPNSYIGSSLAGGLGAGIGQALGAKLGAPDREVIAAVGDGSYMFGNPLPAAFVGRAENLPTLTIVSNNRTWMAVRRATLDVYPDGKAAKANKMPLTELNPSPDFEKVVESCGGFGAKVDTPDDLLPALRRALDAVRSGTPAVLNVHTQGRR